MKKTENFNLNQWEPHDEIKVEDFNSDNQKIDRTLEQVHELATGCARMAVGSYVGTGTSGESAPNSLTFPFPPKLVFCRMASAVITPVMFYQGERETAYGNTSSAPVYMRWSEDGKTLSWYAKDQGYQQNYANTRYLYAAFG